ncbi:hypothetical protein HDV00_012457 [Rhizophlyctis rosea]|nr:hypothetical protein HDV00_012457 [Rhizophlyctis rosea]
MLDGMETIFKGAYFRVRIVDGNVYFRVLVDWEQTYRTERMFCMLDNLVEAAKKHNLPNSEFYVGVSDGPHVRTDTLTGGRNAGFPLFSRVNGYGFIHIPVPDPVEQGCYGGYALGENSVLPWSERVSKAFFRGSTSQYDFLGGNWHVSQRIKVAQYATTFPDLLDAGVTKIFKMKEFGGAGPETVENIVASTGIKILNTTSLNDQMKYKYIIDIDGGLGSSRKRSILASASVLIQQDSMIYLHYQPLMEPYRHYIPLDTHLRNLPTIVRTLQKNDKAAHFISQQSLEFYNRYLTREADILYWSIVLRKYTALLTHPPTDTRPVGVNQCEVVPNQKMAFLKGLSGCSSGWLRWDGQEERWRKKFHDKLDVIRANRKAAEAVQKAKKA